MKKLILLLLSIFVLVSCNKEDDTGTLQLKYKLTYQDDPLIMNKDYTYDQWEVFFSRFHFMVSHINLMAPNGDFPVKEYDKVSFTEPNLDSLKAQEGITYTYPDIKTDDYTGIRFGIGLDEQTNAMSPSDFSTDHLLGNSGDYWAPWDSYIFTKTEGKVFLESGEPPVGFAFHTGGDQSFREVNFPGNISITPNYTTTVIFEIDLYEVLQNEEGEPIDLSTHQTAHNEQDQFLMDDIMNHLQSALVRVD